ncbi:MAG: MerR family transcriptional regulator [Rhizobacter sp.]|nr:MerR family transcriptional regulator [Ferruginibacter sp.]
MEKEQMIPVSEFCMYHNVELSFIYSLKNSGLIDIEVVCEKMFVSTNELKQLETLMRLKEEMDINLEGIEAISYLLQRINEMQQVILQLNNRLDFYESGKAAF